MCLLFALNVDVTYIQCKCASEWMNECVNERANQRMSEQTSKRKKVCLCVFRIYMCVQKEGKKVAIAHMMTVKNNFNIWEIYRTVVNRPRIPFSIFAIKYTTWNEKKWQMREWEGEGGGDRSKRFNEASVSHTQANIWRKMNHSVIEKCKEKTRISCSIPFFQLVFSCCVVVFVSSFAKFHFEMNRQLKFKIEKIK